MAKNHSRYWLRILVSFHLHFKWTQRMNSFYQFKRRLNISGDKHEVCYFHPCPGITAPKRGVDFPHPFLLSTKSLVNILADDTTLPSHLSQQPPVSPQGTCSDRCSRMAALGKKLRVGELRSPCRQAHDKFHTHSQRSKLNSKSTDWAIPMSGAQRPEVAWIRPSLANETRGGR